ncbi:TPA: hypothetical protein U0K44_000382 [Streptococcus suis]|nr:hypothetical protein [Streptococcus suis]
MERLIMIDGKEYRLRTNAFTPIAYRNQFGRDYFQDMLTMFKGEQLAAMLQNQTEGQETPEVDMTVLENFDMTFFNRLFWVFAKSADPFIKPYEQFFMEMDSFPVSEIAPQLMELLEKNMKTKKK